MLFRSGHGPLWRFGRLRTSVCASVSPWPDADLLGRHHRQMPRSIVIADLQSPLGINPQGRGITRAMGVMHAHRPPRQYIDMLPAGREYTEALFQCFHPSIDLFHAVATVSATRSTTSGLKPSGRT